MKNKIAIALVAAIVLVFGIIFISKVISSMPKAKKAASAVETKADKKIPAAPAKKAISKGKGALVIEIIDSKDKNMTVGIKAFKNVDNRSSVYAANFMSNKSHELLPGTYDIEVATTPAKIYKNIKVSEGRENIEKLGKITGSINARLLNAQKKEVRYVMRIVYPNTTTILTAGVTNKPMEVVPGTYDIEIETLPKYINKGVKVEAGKEALLDIGVVSGTLFVKAADNSGKEVREAIRITRSSNNEFVSSSITNRRIELLEGSYNIEVMSNPKQLKKDIAVKAGEEAMAEFTVQPPPVKATAVKPVALPAKK